MTFIPLSEISKKSPYYQVLKEAEQKQERLNKIDWKILKVQLVGIYLVVQVVVLYYKLKKKLLNIFIRSEKKSKKDISKSFKEKK